jgi:hypothetical protein
MRGNQASPNHLDELGVFALMAQALAYPVPGSESVANRSSATAPLDSYRLLERIAHWLRPRHSHDIEAPAAPAARVPAVDAPMRAIERAIPHPYY